MTNVSNPEPQVEGRKTLPCFKAYDVRGRLDSHLNGETSWCIGAAFADVLRPSSVVIGHDCRASSIALHDALASGLSAFGVDVFSIGMAGTEEVYFATSHLGVDGGIEVTASHNPVDYNGMKFVGPESRPLSETEFRRVGEAAAATQAPSEFKLAEAIPVATRAAYVEHVLSLVDLSVFPPCKILANAGNGTAGPVFDAIVAELQMHIAELDVVRLHHEPDGTFPNGIPNPLLPENRPVTANAVRDVGANLGLAWDGDFDRCFFFDHTGAFVDGEYVVGLLAAAFLSNHRGEMIVHDPRLIWNTREQVARAGGQAFVSRTGHTHIKRAMHETGAIYGGEMSAHHYFREFMCCDSGMIPWLKVLELMGKTGRSLSDLVADMAARFPSSGERNFTVPDPAALIEATRDNFVAQALRVDTLDGLSMEFPTWRMNLRSSSTEPLVRLNVETRGDPELVTQKVEELRALICSFGGHPTGSA